MMNTSSFLNGKPFTVTREQFDSLNRVRKPWRCALCGHLFEPGDKARFVYLNSRQPAVIRGNALVCGDDDADDEVVYQRILADDSEFRRLKKLGYPSAWPE